MRANSFPATPFKDLRTLAAISRHFSGLDALGADDMTGFDSLLPRWTGQSLRWHLRSDVVLEWVEYLQPEWM